MSKDFHLSGGDADFNSRQKSVFDQLGAISSPSSTSSSVSLDDFQSHRESTSRRTQQKRSHETRHLRGQESLFKRPEPPNPRWRGQNKRMPDHRTHPQKWTHYSLGDVSNDDMSDRTNTSTALSFLNELRKRKERDSDQEMDLDRTQQTVQFKKPVQRRNKVETFQPSAERNEPRGTLFRGSKRVMPEYVVGQKSGQGAKKVRDVKDKNEAKKSDQMRLTHLMDAEGDEDSE